MHLNPPVLATPLDTIERENQYFPHITKLYCLVYICTSMYVDYDGGDMSSDNAALLSYYNCSNSDEALLEEPEGHDHVTSSDAHDPPDKSHTVTTISRLVIELK